MDFSAFIQSNLGQQLLPVFGAVLILLIGWLVAVVVRALVRTGLHRVGLNSRFGGVTGLSINLENLLALVAYGFVILLTLMGMFNLLDLSILSSPFAALSVQLFDFAPRLFAGLILALVALVVASLARVVVNKALSSTQLDEKLSQHAGMKPISVSLGHAVFWLLILLFLPAILNALKMDGLLEPLRDMTTRLLGVLPNVLGALIIGGIGWIVAQVLSNICVNLLQVAGADGLGSKAGLSEKAPVSGLVGKLVFVLVFLPALIAALDALKVEAISRPAIGMLDMMMQSVPKVVAAGLILVVTWLVASFVSRLIASLLAGAGFDKLPERLGLAHAFEATSASTLVGRVALFFAMLFASVEAADQLNFHKVSDVVTTFITFGGDVLLGSAIFVIGFLLANVAYEAIDRASGENTKGLARVARYAILALVVAMGLRAMGIADDIVNLAFGLTLGAIAVAVALSFGLGGREAAGQLMNRWLSKLPMNSENEKT
jgi:hypothetical protein